jgi:hypothetical protein
MRELDTVKFKFQSHRFRTSFQYRLRRTESSQQRDGYKTRAASPVIPSLGESKKEFRKLNLRNLVGHLVVKDCYNEYDARTAKRWIYKASSITRHTAKG